MRKQGPAKSRAFAFNREKGETRTHKPRLNPFLRRLCTRKYPVGSDQCTIPPSNRTSHRKSKHPNASSAATSSPTATDAAALPPRRRHLLLPPHPQTGARPTRPPRPPLHLRGPTPRRRFNPPLQYLPPGGNLVCSMSTALRFTSFTLCYWRHPAASGVLACISENT
jgi:hypothetical protein